uniref:sigma factor-like helix-turn-helix DNA-binding protein n=1 Tax=Enterocloster clostridioformis TaxID=1531 RepID=UPI0025A567A5|nr:RNA polymerase subunit sigma-70 [Enterocloster clostridioformis]
MNVKEYLHQSYRLDQRIKSDTMEAQNLREMAGSVSAIQYDQDRVQSSRSTDAPFIRALEKLWELEKKIAAELETLSALKKQIREVIEAVPDTDERMVLKYRYIHNYTWEQIGVELSADARTIRRWHGKALTHATVPDDPIVI